jgi:tenascin
MAILLISTSWLLSSIATLDEGCSVLGHCHGNGVCHDGATFGALSRLPGAANFTTAVCLCDPHWRGLECTIPTCPVGCHGRGACASDHPVPPTATAGRAGGPRWGVMSGLQCVCDQGWGGEDCGSRLCVANNCSGRGQCTEGQVCICSVGWSGAACEQRVCTPLGNCSGHGACIDGKCHCASGWQGGACELRACEDDCSGHGACASNGSCMCDAGYGGASCADFGCPNSCNGRGRCLGYGLPSPTCRCDPGWGGADCAARVCPDACGERGACVAGRCLCANGWGGPRCVNTGIPARSLCKQPLQPSPGCATC